MLDLYPVGDIFACALFRRERRRCRGTLRRTSMVQALPLRPSGRDQHHGGVRSGVFQAHGELIKYPLIRWDLYCSLGRTIYRPRPHYTILRRLWALLRIQDILDIGETAARRREEGQYYKGEDLQGCSQPVDGAGSIRPRIRGFNPFAGADDLIRRALCRCRSKPTAAIDAYGNEKP